MRIVISVPVPSASNLVTLRETHKVPWQNRFLPVQKNQILPTSVRKMKL
jgi:hypothetical protein